MLWHWMADSRKAAALMDFLNEYNDLDYDPKLIEELIDIIDNYEKN